jgi:hypothetical protein
MAARAANQIEEYRSTRAAKFFLALGLVAGVGFASAQDNIDPKSPLPPLEPTAAALAEKFRIDKNLRIYQGSRDLKTGKRTGGIEDFTPVASEKDNSDEYQAWHAVVVHAKQFTAGELEQNGSRDLTRDDLTTVTNSVPRFLGYRLDLFRFDGKLLRVRRIEASLSLKQAGTTELYEALFVPLDEPLPLDDKGKVPAHAVSFVFTELPEALAAVKHKTINEWLETNSWASVAGYFFKVKDDGLPILIGKSVTVLKAEPVAPGDNPAAIDKNLRVFRLIKDRAVRARGEDNWEEVVAWNRVMLHARRFSPEDLEKYANGDLKFHMLFDEARRDYKLDLVKFEGRLIKLDKTKASEKLLEAGVEFIYEGWIVPKDEPSGNPICVVFTDPPDGIEPTGRVNKWVSFAGYSFKLLKYTSGERNAKDPNKYDDKLAPLLLGRAVIERPDPDGRSVSWGDFFTGSVAIITLVLGFAVGVAWWFRRGDRKAKQEIQAHRTKNPFGEQAS